MFGLPEWAIGVAVILLAAAVGRTLVARFTPPGQVRERFRGKMSSRREMAATVEELKDKLGGVEEVESRLTEIDDLQRRLADVEERLDFTERMLAQQRESQRLSPPQK